MTNPAARALGVPDPCVSPLRWEGGPQDGRLLLLDQTLLPTQERVRTHERADGVIQDIRRLAVRGAPVLGVAGAYALVLAAREAIARASPGASAAALRADLACRAAEISGARPTAVNLPAAVARGLEGVAELAPPQWCAALLEHAADLARREAQACSAIGLAGARWLGTRRRFLTHCNAGALVSTGIGTALAPIYVLAHNGASLFVYADETRPLLQGLRLTAYELGRAGIAHAVIADSAAAGLLRSGGVDAVIVGADRIAANGDVCNKVGTYPLALAARAAGVPFVVAAPTSTVDLALASGQGIPIEDRPGDLERYLLKECLPGPLGAPAPAFDITPAGLVSALITEAGVLEPPFPEALRQRPNR